MEDESMVNFIRKWAAAKSKSADGNCESMLFRILFCTYTYTGSQTFETVIDSFAMLMFAKICIGFTLQCNRSGVYESSGKGIRNPPLKGPTSKIGHNCTAHLKVSCNLETLSVEVNGCYRQRSEAGWDYYYGFNSYSILEKLFF